VVALRTLHQAAFGELVSGWFTAAGSAAARGRRLDRRSIGRSVLQSVLHLVCASTEDDGPPPAGWRSLRICRAATAVVEQWQDAEAPPTVADLCAGAGVSERTLQYAFRDHVGMSPVAHLRCRRLNGARAALLAADPQAISVTDVAMRFSFLHLGRFAGDYKRLFGEAPSVTLSR
jgi:AraC family ethanolamine operon transcriptional activator